MHERLAILLLTAITLNPLHALGADHPVVIGGPGVLKFTPSFVVRPSVNYLSRNWILMNNNRMLPLETLSPLPLNRRITL